MNKKLKEGIIFGFGLIIVFIGFLWIIYVFNGFNTLDYFKHKYLLIEESKLTGLEANQIKELSQHGKIISAETLFTQTLSYYNTIITFLVAILGILAAFAFIYIKWSSDEKVREHVEGSTTRYFETQKFDEGLDSKIRDEFKNFLGEEPRDVNRRLNLLEENMEVIQDKIGINKEEKLKVMKEVKDGDNKD